LPTPAATEYGSSQNGINGKGGRFERPSAGTPSLSTMARKGLWPEKIPTPTAGDAKSAANRTATRHNPDSKHHDGVTLTDHVRMWPTPTARLGDSRGAQAKRYHNPERSNDLDDAVAASGTLGSLNPTFVEWLQGFPMGWTEVD
jgi:hypothetical protein